MRRPFFRGIETVAGGGQRRTSAIVGHSEHTLPKWRGWSCCRALAGAQAARLTCCTKSRTSALDRSLTNPRCDHNGSLIAVALALLHLVVAGP